MGLVVYGRVFGTKRAPRSPLADFSAAAETRGRWRVGMLHGSLAVPGQGRVRTTCCSRSRRSPRSGLDYLALGHWHSFRKGRVGHHDVGLLRRAGGGRDRPGRRRPGAARDARGGSRRRDRRADPGRPDALPEAGCRRRRRCAPRTTWCAGCMSWPNPDLVLEARLAGVAADTLDLNEDEIALAAPGLVPRVPPAQPERAGAPGRPAAAARHDRRRLHPRHRGTHHRGRGSRR